MQFPINAIVLLKQSMQCNAFTNMYWCLHFSDNFDKDKEGSNIFFDDKHEMSKTTQHQQKFGKVEYAINWQWKEYVAVGLALTHDESPISRWYKNKITCGPEPKPIWTGMMPHSLAISFGILAGYKLHARMFGRKEDGK